MNVIKEGDDALCITATLEACMRPYGLMADLHLFNWNAFSGTDDKGRNTRLAGLLQEIGRCAAEVKSAGGDTIYIAGDTFHVRGSIAPSVLNPTLDVFKAIIASGVKVIIIPGNHDLEGKHATRLGSAITALEGVGCEVIEEPMSFGDYAETRSVLAIPWIDKIEDLKSMIGEWIDALDGVEDTDLILHAPIDGVLAGIPCHGLDPEWLGGLGFRSVYAGHYHNHKEFDHNVFSIGALAHHSWSDIGSKAGFLIVGDSGPRWMKSHLPEFIDITGDVDPDDLPLLVEGNFVRAKIESSKMSDVESLRAELNGLGAKGVVIQNVKKAVVAREGAIAASVSAGASLETSVATYIKAQSFPDAALIAAECMNILAEAGC